MIKIWNVIIELIRNVFVIESDVYEIIIGKFVKYGVYLFWYICFYILINIIYYFYIFGLVILLLYFRGFRYVIYLVVNRNIKFY